MEERFLFRQVEPKDYRMFRCVVRYGYKDPMEGPKEFEFQLVEHLKEFVRHEHYIHEAGPTEVLTAQQLNVGCLSHSGQLLDDVKVDEPAPSRHIEECLEQSNTQAFSDSNHLATVNGSTNSPSRIISGTSQGVEDEIQFIQKAMEKGVVYLLGETEVGAEQNSSWVKKIAVNYMYDFLRKNFRQGIN
ncbi:Potassium transporter [Thalictrum thalictroides]|uniref:Potassium transporter n=1 Tax=Thalictrum thalictroides TaxID=46969 RepID=A0A7J6UTV9_THATH|nr:Potassium transporter [Thalictrum thalictroides]